MLLPPPRRDLRVLEHPSGLVVEDAVTHHRTHLGPESRQVWDALHSGLRSPAALIEALPLEPAVIGARLDAIERALLLESPRWHSARPLFEAPRPAASETLRLDPLLRHRCVGCGSSCHQVSVGPVGEASVEVVVSSGLWAGRAPEAASMFMSTAAGRFMQRDATEGCLALDPRGCAIHAEGGVEAKPPACRQFPYFFTRTPEGVDVGMQVECRQLEAALAAGASEPIEQELAAVVPLSAGVLTLDGPVTLAPGLFLPWAEYRGWWSLACESSFEAAVASAVALAEAQGAGVVDSVWQQPQPDFVEAERALFDALADALRPLGKDGLSLSAEPMELLRKGLLLLRGHPAPQTHLAEGTDALLGFAARAELRGHEPVRMRDLLFGLGRLRLQLDLALQVARLRALQASRLRVCAQDLNDALVVCSRGLRAPTLALPLRRHAAALRWRLAAQRPWAGWLGH